MEISSAMKEQLWDEQQRTLKIQKELERRRWLRNFTLVFALIVLTLAAVVLMSGSANETIRL
jgi:hypothetical protein